MLVAISLNILSAECCNLGYSDKPMQITSANSLQHCFTMRNVRTDERIGLISKSALCSSTKVLQHASKQLADKRQQRGVRHGIHGCVAMQLLEMKNYRSTYKHVEGEFS